MYQYYESKLFFPYITHFLLSPFHREQKKSGAREQDILVFSYLKYFCLGKPKYSLCIFIYSFFFFLTIADEGKDHSCCFFYRSEGQYVLTVSSEVPVTFAPTKCSLYKNSYLWK